MERWKDEVALITGASSGIGEAVARKLSAAGMKVVLAARRGERIETLAAELPGEALAVPTDLRDLASVDTLFAKARGFGGVRVMVNNAGLGKDAPLMSGDAERWREMLEVNVLGLCVCTREAVKDMRASGDRGHVFHVSSMAAHRVPEGSGVYSATKFAVRSLTEGLRKELRAAGSGIRVTSISPGFVETEFAFVYHDDPARAEKTYQRFKVLEADDVADALVYALAAPDHVQVHDLLMRPTEQPS